MPGLQLPGVYTCTVWNSQGNTTKSFTVIDPESKILALNPASFLWYVCIYTYFLCSSFYNSFMLLISAASNRGTTAAVVLAVFFRCRPYSGVRCLSDAAGSSSSDHRIWDRKSNNLPSPAGDRTTFAATVGAFVAMGVLLAIVGLYFVTPDGTFAFSKGGYQRGQPAPSGPVWGWRVETSTPHDGACFRCLWCVKKHSESDSNLLKGQVVFSLHMGCIIAWMCLVSLLCH